LSEPVFFTSIDQETPLLEAFQKFSGTIVLRPCQL
jgi:hypothetical protein